MILKLAPVALLSLAALVPTCTGTVWGTLPLLGIVCGIFFGTISLGSKQTSDSKEILADNKS